MCLAGHVAVQAGAAQPSLEDVVNDIEWFVKPDGSLGSEYEYHDSGDVVRVNRWASDKLGLNVYEREYLFFFFGDADALNQRVGRLIELWESGQEMNDWEIQS